MSLSLNVFHSGHAPTQILLRFGNFLLACVLYALHFGDSLSQEIASLCQMAGLCGFAFYFALELVADQRAREEREGQQNMSLRVSMADQQLAYRLFAEQKMAKILDRERRRRF